LLGLRNIGRRRLLQVMIATALASTVLMAIVANGSINAAYYSTYTRLSGLVLGSAMAFFFAPYMIRGRPGRGARGALDLAGLAGMFVLLWSFHHFSFPGTTSSGLDVFRGGFLLVDLATLLVIAAVVHPASDVGPILGIRPLRWVGLRSYGIYLWHYPIFCVTRPGLDVPIVPLRRDADPERRDRALHVSSAHGTRRPAAPHRPIRGCRGARLDRRSARAGRGTRQCAG
jgi:peptidoglycan/LPS O-acetylase OafA/YrhL